MLVLILRVTFLLTISRVRDATESMCLFPGVICMSMFVLGGRNGLLVVGRILRDVVFDGAAMGVMPRNARMVGDSGGWRRCRAPAGRWSAPGLFSGACRCLVGNERNRQTSQGWKTLE